MQIVSSLSVAVIFLGLMAIPVRAEAEQSSATSQSGPGPARTSRAKISKTELASRFQELKSKYATIKTTAEKFAPLKADAALDLKVTRLKLSAAMRSYDYYERLTQKQRDGLNLLSDLSEIESLRLQVSMDRLANMQAMISGLLQKMNETGDAIHAMK